MTELGDQLRDALQGRSGADASQDDPLFAAATRVIGSIRAVLSAYGIRADELDHAIRMLRCTIHGYAMLQAADAFQWSNDPSKSVAWMIRFFDAGLTAVGDNAP
jgi:hypothetical protein